MCSSCNGTDLLHTIDLQSLRWLQKEKKKGRKKNPTSQITPFHPPPKNFTSFEKVVTSRRRRSRSSSSLLLSTVDYLSPQRWVWQLNWFPQALFFFFLLKIQLSVLSTTPACQAAALMGAAGTGAQICVLTCLGKLSEKAQKDRGR